MKPEGCRLEGRTMSVHPYSNCKRVTTRTLREKKKRGEPITMLTAYDYPTAMAIDQTGIDVVLVGDSVGMVVLGYSNTLPVTMDDMIHHCRAVARGAPNAHLIGDMPFMSYQVSPAEAVRNAGRFLQEGGMDGVKLEGGSEKAETIRAIVAAGIPVMGHIGLTPQSVHQLGGWRAQGKTVGSAKRLLEDALVLEDSGCYALVLEVIPDRLAGLITRRLKIPTIGIGAGSECDGQVLVTHDLLGLSNLDAPRFAKRYLDLYSEMSQAFLRFKQDVIEHRFPALEHAHHMEDEVFSELQKELDPGSRNQDS
jgi:3-methyl-2-oxobutanoate hydroxymethyltransferase